MLTRIEVQDFKSLQDVSVDLGLINVFIGANGSGKTNLLEAIGFLSAVAGGRPDDQGMLRRGVRPAPVRLVPSSSAGRKEPDQFVLSASWGQGQESLRYTAEVAVPLGSDQPWRYKPRYFQNDTEITGPEVFVHGSQKQPVFSSWEESGSPPREIFREKLSDLGDYGVFAPTTPVLRGTETDMTQRRPVGLAGGQLPEAVDKLLDVRKGKLGTLDLDDLLELLDWVDKIAIVPPSGEIVSPSVPTTRNIIRFTDRWMREGRNQLSAHDASEGALYLLFALVLALHPQSPRLFAIEHLDQAMHPRLARAATRLFCQQMLGATPERQALLTTHNPLVLDGLDLRDDRIRLFAVERDRQGATKVNRIPVSDEVLQATQEGLSLSNLWVMGRLGGVPDLF